MSSIQHCVLAIVVLCAGLACRASDDVASDHEIAVGNVPENIIKAAKEKFQVAKFLTAEKRTSNKKLVHFSLEIKLKDKSTIDAYFDGDGKLLRTGVSATVDTVPTPVKDAFNKQYADWTVTEINKETDLENKRDVYSVDINKGGKQLELDFAPDGTIVKTLELKDED